MVFVGKVRRTLWLLAFVLISLICPMVSADDLYCGKRNCYEILGVEKTSSAGEVKKAYRKLTLQYHPDRNPDPEAVSIFLEVTTAYEVLTSESKEAYDDYLAHPERVYINKLNYAVYARKTNGYFVVFCCIAAITIIHYKYWQHAHEKLKADLRNHPQFQEALKKYQTDEEKDEAVKGLIKINGWQARPPTMSDLLIWRMIELPWDIFERVFWLIRWTILFTWLKQPYGFNEKSYLTANAINLSLARWQRMDEDKKLEYMEHELWDEKNLKKYQEEERLAEMKASRGRNGARRR